ncbi:MAG: hypothetical protein PVH21_15465 [Myxococcales bacterium]
MPLVFLLFIAFATAVSAAHAGRDEVRLSLEPIWRMQTFSAYVLFLGFVVVPTAMYFYVFHGDWFLFYLADTGAAPWLWGILTVLSLLGAAAAGFRLGAAFCRASRDVAARRATIGVLLMGLCVWPLAWSRLRAVGSYRQFTRDYGLVAFPTSPACYSGIAMLVIGVIAFVWVVMRISEQTHQPASG